MLLLPPATLTPEAFGELLVGSLDGQLVPLGVGGRPSARPRGRRSSTASRCSAACWSRSTCAGATWSASSTRRARRSRRQVDAARRACTLEWGGQFENFTRASKRLGVGGADGAGGHLRHAVPDVRRPALRGRGVRRRAASRWSAACWRCALRGLPFSIPAAVGFIAVAGVAVLNGVVMAGEVRAPPRRWRPATPATRSGGSAATVLRPVLTTALVAAIGFIPMAHLDARRRRGAAPARHGGHRRHPLVDAARAGGAAGDAPPAAAGPTADEAAEPDADADGR